MTGTWQEVKDVCKAYRVYFSTPADVKPGQDYLVDHSIYFYLMGEFVGYFWFSHGKFAADMTIQIPRVTLSRPSDATSPLRRPRRSSTITSLTGGERSTGHEMHAIDVYRDVKILYTNSLNMRLSPFSLVNPRRVGKLNSRLGHLTDILPFSLRISVKNSPDRSHFGAPYTRTPISLPLMVSHSAQPTQNRRSTLSGSVCSSKKNDSVHGYEGG